MLNKPLEMSETQVLGQLSLEDDKPDRSVPAANDEDLEDGEIDDDDDDNNQQTVAANSSGETPVTQHLSKDDVRMPDTENSDDWMHDNASNPASSVKSKKPHPVEDDHASSIENAIASALKKKGIEPPMPKIEPRNGLHSKEFEILPGQGQSRSSRRRKRKKQRDEKEKNKERKEKKKKRYDSPDQKAGDAPPLDNPDDMDDYEMLNVRGGSPVPKTHLASQTYNDQYDSAEEDSYTSYDSYESMGEHGGGDGGNRRRKRGKKESRKRRERSGRHRDDQRRQDKRSRRDSDDEKHRQEPRKLELCKFYLMECCAKKDKCSYMHSDFPCKFYYLGMDCPNKEDCKFSHGEPLSEQLRNILLKHLETAPKEILGNFKRITRDHAITQITKRHEELCKEHGVENTWAPVIILPPMHNRRGDQHQQNHQQQQQQQQQHQQQMQQQQHQQPHNNIPSLLDMVINPPILEDNEALGVGLHSKADKQRKSRWADTAAAAAAIEAPSYLDLKNLKGLLSDEHMEKLSQMGIINLKQVEQLTFAQLNEIGLTVAEMTEIQLNAKNMAQLGIAVSPRGGVGGTGDGVIEGGVIASTAEPIKSAVDSISSNLNRDVDLRFLPSTISTTTTTTSPTTKKDAVGSQEEPDKEVILGSNSNSNNGRIAINYTQYLKDSNLTGGRQGGEVEDDDDDEEKVMIIVDENDEQHDKAVSARAHLTKETSSVETRSHAPVGDGSLNNPFSALYSGESQKLDESGFARKAALLPPDQLRRNPFKVYKDSYEQNDDSDIECHYTDRGRRRSSSPSRSRSPSHSRSRSHTPTRSQSTTPEASQSPEPDEPTQLVYEHKTMYDFNAEKAAKEEAEYAEKKLKTDKDLRFLPGSEGDFDLRLPFQPVLNYTPATEIEAAMRSHLPINYRVHEILLSKPSYFELRRSNKSSQTSDPRLRRILGLPELLPSSTTSAVLTRNVRKLSSCIASPETGDESPKNYTPPSGFGFVHEEQGKPGAVRVDPRRAAAAAAAQVASSKSDTTKQSTPSKSSSTAGTTAGGAAIKQNTELRSLLQKSLWYQELNSKFKIMVNQQLALVSTELKRFHQDESPNKIFDISFIVNNATLQQILTNLGIFIDDNGEVMRVDGDSDDSPTDEGGIRLPNLSLPPPHPNQMDFLRAPPPNMAQTPILFGAPPPPIGGLPPAPFGSPPTRPSLLGLPPGAPVPHFNPFAAGNVGAAGAGNFVGGPIGGPGLLGAAPPGFGNFPSGMPVNIQQRNFGGHRGQRNQNRNQNRRNNNYGGSGVGAGSNSSGEKSSGAGKTNSQGSENSQ